MSKINKTKSNGAKTEQLETARELIFLKSWRDGLSISAKLIYFIVDINSAFKLTRIILVFASIV